MKLGQNRWRPESEREAARKRTCGTCIYASRELTGLFCDYTGDGVGKEQAGCIHQTPRPDQE